MLNAGEFRLFIYSEIVFLFSYYYSPYYQFIAFVDLRAVRKIV